MFVKSKFNVEVEKYKIKHKGKYIAEFKEVDNLLNSDHKNVCLEYLTKREALNAGVSIRKYIKSMKKEKTLAACQQDKFVIVIKAGAINAD